MAGLSSMGGNEIMPLRSRFGLRLKAIAAESGQSLASLATRANLKPERLDDILRGTADCVTLCEMAALAETCGASLFELLAPGTAARIVSFEEVEQGRSRYP
jgi:transcriptional regulator with XRE-family HTH domain